MQTQGQTTEEETEAQREDPRDPQLPSNVQLSPD